MIADEDIGIEIIAMVAGMTVRGVVCGRCDLSFDVKDSDGNIFEIRQASVHLLRRLP